MTILNETAGEHLWRYVWAVTPEKAQTAIHKIVEVSQPRKVILFGSYVHENTGINSELDLLVVTGNHIKNPGKESIRIRRALRGIRMAMDILVVPETLLEEMANVPGLIYREAMRSGKVVYESERVESLYWQCRKSGRENP